MCRPDGMAERRRVRPSAIEQRAGSDPPSSSSSPSTTAHHGFMALHGLLMIGRRSRAPVRLPCHVEPVQLSRPAVTRGRGLHSAARVHSKGGGSGDGDGRDPWRGRCVALPARSVAPLQSAFSALCWQRGSGGGEGAFLLCGASFSAPALQGRSTGRLRHARLVGSAAEEAAEMAAQGDSGTWKAEKTLPGHTTYVRLAADGAVWQCGRSRASVLVGVGMCSFA